MISHPSSNCSLVSITPEAENAIVYCARVSNPGNQANKETSSKLLKYLINHSHWSPFEMANMTVEINTSRAISAQIIRHRSFSFQEFSLRYSNIEDLDAILIPKLRRQDKKNRQNSIDDIEERKLNAYYCRISKIFEESRLLYQEMIGDGIAKECARAILPLASPTRLYMNGTIRSWIHYLKIRSGVETQLEHREIALNLLGIFKQYLPNIHEVAFGDQ